MHMHTHTYPIAPGTRVVQVSAVQYVDYLMTWVEGLLDNEAVFPVREGMPFPPNFVSVVRKIFCRLFRVYGHIYHSHFEEISLIGAAPHLNTCFKVGGHARYGWLHMGCVDPSTL